MEGRGAYVDNSVQGGHFAAPLSYCEPPSRALVVLLTAGVVGDGWVNSGNGENKGRGSEYMG